MHYVIMNSSGEPAGTLQAETLRKMFSYTAAQLMRAQKDEGFLPPTEKKALEEISAIQSRHTELI
jgi:hypothetical protein